MPEQAALVEQFTALYGGGLAQSLRDAGDPSAMPPWAETRWLGKQISKCPMDLWVYQEIIWETKPDLIIETGTGGGGSAMFFAHILDQIGEGHIKTFDTQVYPALRVQHRRISYHALDSLSGDAALEAWFGADQYRRIMIVLDSLHTYGHVKRELELYAPLVSVGCYLVVEDTGMGGSAAVDWCSRAAAEFVSANPNFVVDKSREKHLLTSNKDGWLKRVA